MNIKPKNIKKCLVCGKEFQTYPYLIKNGNGKYCSRNCSCKVNKTKIVLGQRLSPRTEFKKGLVPHNFKQKGYGYKCLHDWIKRRLTKINKCQMCGEVKNRLECANKSGMYKREINDWIKLCVKCHRKYDKENGTHTLYGPRRWKFAPGE